MVDYKKILNKFGRIEKPVVPSGILPIDIHLHGGIALGGFYNIGADEGAGKSTLLLQLSKYQIEENNGTVVYIDTEQGIQDEQLEAAGLMPYLGDKFRHINDVVSFTDLKDYMAALIEDKMSKESDIDATLVIIDSLNGASPQTIIDGDVEARKIAPVAKPMSEWCKAIRGRAGVAKICVFCVAQTGVNIGATQWEPSTYIKLPKAVVFAADATFMIDHPTYKNRAIKNEDDKSIGFTGNMWTIKNRKAMPYIKLPLPMIFGKGFDKVRFVGTTMETFGVTETYGEKYTMHLDEGDVVVKGEEAYFDYIATNLSSLVSMMFTRGFYDLSNKADFAGSKSFEIMSSAEAEQCFDESFEDDGSADDNEVGSLGELK